MCDDKLATRPEAALLRPVVAPDELIKAQQETHTLIKEALEEDRDYGKIPGTNKPTLLKPGAERLNLAFGVYPRYIVTEAEVHHTIELEWEKRNGQSGTSRGMYRYVVRCELVRRGSEDVVADGIGSASTLESKYCDRPRELENTVLKMAQKRAFVAATLNAYALSDRFTQDMEDTAIDTPSQQSQPRQPSGGGGGGGFNSTDVFRFAPKQCKDASKGMPLSEATDKDLHEYRSTIEWAIGKGKGYADQAHLDAIDIEIARRENGDDGNGREGAEPQPADEGAPPPHDDDDIPF